MKLLKIKNIIVIFVFIFPLLSLISCSSWLETETNPKKYNNFDHIPQGGGHYKLGEPYQINDVWYYPKVDSNYNMVGVASWYGDYFHGRLTANGEYFDMNTMSAAHPTLPLPSYVRVTNLENNKEIIVRVNDRGPFKKNRIIDLSKKAAESLDMVEKGTAKVRVQYIRRAPLEGNDSDYFKNSKPGFLRKVWRMTASSLSNL
jgi:rare lipoprotein A